MRLRVMAWNVHGFRGGTAQAVEAVAAVEPDIILLNETRYSGFRLRRFAGRLQMQAASGLHGLRRIPNAILARPPWRVVRSETMAFPRARRTTRRGAVIAMVGRAGTRVSAVAVHLGLAEGERLEDVRVLSDRLAGRDPVVIGGDLNEGPDGRAVRWIGGRFWDAFERAGQGEGTTFPASEPRARIDYLFVSQGVSVDTVRVGGPGFSDRSDHLPVIADLVLGEMT
jgi:endonuclease/exonuclease/phosphatase family metal-dependent hydrolase